MLISSPIGSSDATATSHAGILPGVDLVLPSGYWSRIRAELLSDTSRESICHLLCGQSQVDDRLRLLACYLVVPQADDYVSQSLQQLQLHSSYDLSLRDECQRSQLSLIDLHSHPMEDGPVHFSHLDDRDEWEKFRYFQRNLPGLRYGSVVLGRQATAGRVFLPQADSPEPRVVPLRIIRRDTPLGESPEEDRVRDGEERFDRQVRAFGAAGQRNLASLQVGIIGLGGLGSLLALGLTRLGVRRFVLVDPDRASITNLNRVAGMSQADVQQQTTKVDLVARRMLEIDPQLEVERRAVDLFEPPGWQAVRGVDLLVVATDNHASRMLANALAHQYLIPLVSVGTRIQTRDGGLENGFAEFYSVLPGQSAPCLLCSHMINATEAFYDLASEENRRRAAARGYITEWDEPAPSVVHLNGVIANLAMVEIHNLCCGFMPPQSHLLYTLKERRLLSIDHEPGHCAACAPDGWNFARGDRVDPVAQLFPHAVPEVALP